MNEHDDDEYGIGLRWFEGVEEMPCPAAGGIPCAGDWCIRHGQCEDEAGFWDEDEELRT